MSEQKHDQAPFWGHNDGYFNKANNAILFLFRLKKSCLKKFNKRREFIHPKFPRARAKQTCLKFATFAYIRHRAQPKLKSPS